MRHDQAFAALLERELELGTSQPDRRPSGTPSAHRQAAPHPFLFVERRFFFNATVYASRTGPAGARQTGPAVAAPDLFRPGMPLAPQEQAPAKFVGLEANLRADFTAGELRSAFRALARQYHPDSHPGSSEAAKMHLSRRFAELTESYRRLLASIEPVGTIRH